MDFTRICRESGINHLGITSHLSVVTVVTGRLRFQQKQLQIATALGCREFWHQARAIWHWHGATSIHSGKTPSAVKIRLHLGRSIVFGAGSKPFGAIQQQWTFRDSLQNLTSIARYLLCIYRNYGTHQHSIVKQCETVKISLRTTSKRILTIPRKSVPESYAVGGVCHGWDSAEFSTAVSPKQWLDTTLGLQTSSSQTGPPLCNHTYPFVLFPQLDHWQNSLGPFIPLGGPVGNFPFHQPGPWEGWHSMTCQSGWWIHRLYQKWSVNKLWIISWWCHNDNP